MLNISVAMCTYNGSRYLPAQLQSLMAQQALPSELVVCDDGSNDTTAAIVAEFRRRAPFEVRFVPNPQRLGYAANFMKAVELCRGDLIACCDQDDIWYPEKLMRGAEPFADSDIVLAYHAVDLIDADGKFIRRYDERRPDRSVLPPLSGSPWVFGMGFTLMFRRMLAVGSDLSRLTFDQNIPAKPVSHDQWYTFLASVLGKIAYVDEPLAGYRQHDSNVIGVLKSLVEVRPGLNGRLSVAADEFKRCAAACDGRAAILHRLAPRLIGTQKDRALAGAAKYEQLHSLFALRRDMYENATVVGKLQAIHSLYRAHGYRNEKPWTFGIKALIKDLGYGLIAPVCRPTVRAKMRGPSAS